MRRTLRLLLIGGFLSPPGLLVRAGFILVVFGVLHLLEWRDDTRVLSGTCLPSDSAVARGLLYAAAYFSAVIVCPIMVLAAAIQMAIRRALTLRK